MFKFAAGLIVGTALAIVPVASTSAAGSVTMSLSPASGTYTNGDAFSVGIYENSGSNDVDSASASLTYDASKLQATGITGGVFTTCATSPSASGGVISTGDCTVLGGKKQGSQLLATVSFKTVATGTAAVNFTSGKAVNSGTDLAVSTSNGSYTINAPASGGMGGGGSTGGGSGSGTGTGSGSTGSTSGSSAPKTTTATSAPTTVATNNTTTPDTTSNAAPAGNGSVKSDSTAKPAASASKPAAKPAVVAKKRSIVPWIILLVVAGAVIAYAMTGSKADEAKTENAKADAGKTKATPAKDVKKEVVEAAAAATVAAKNNTKKPVNKNKKHNKKTGKK